MQVAAETCQGDDDHTGDHNGDPAGGQNMGLPRLLSSVALHLKAMVMDNFYCDSGEYQID